MSRIIRMTKSREDEMSRESRTHEGGKECIWGFDGKV
jgi:hypothetical protein